MTRHDLITLTAAVTAMSFSALIPRSASAEPSSGLQAVEGRRLWLSSNFRELDVDRAIQERLQAMSAVSGRQRITKIAVLDPGDCVENAKVADSDAIKWNNKLSMASSGDRYIAFSCAESPTARLALAYHEARETLKDAAKRYRSSALAFSAAKGMRLAGQVSGTDLGADVGNAETANDQAAASFMEASKEVVILEMTALLYYPNSVALRQDELDALQKRAQYDGPKGGMGDGSSLVFNLRDGEDYSSNEYEPYAGCWYDHQGNNPPRAVCHRGGFL